MSEVQAMMVCGVEEEDPEGDDDILDQIRDQKNLRGGRRTYKK